MSEVLVAYFSASGVTAGVAGRLAESIKADLFEIIPETPYIKDELNLIPNATDMPLTLQKRSRKRFNRRVVWSGI